MVPRRPIPVCHSSALPPLESLTETPAAPRGSVAIPLAGVAALAAAAAALEARAPVCGPGRAAELGAHGPAIAREARAGEPLKALRELCLALGYAEHGATRVPDRDILPAGGAMAVPPTVEPPSTPTVIPPSQLVPSEVHRPGGAMRLRPYRNPLPLSQLHRTRTTRTTR
ncbi:MAG: hypothetical protein HY909_16030 [Deltaproteobacteria bacterium]|nr:hypothetical protein [Deltaproteobacteria bacterium]